MNRVSRRLIRRRLQGQGYQVLQGCNGAAALSLAEQYRAPIDLLVTDVVMPQMDGFTLAERVVESHPETGVLFLTGHAEHSMSVRGGLKEARQAFLLKPFDSDRLLRAIREQLDTEANRGSAPPRDPVPRQAGTDGRPVQR